MSIKVEQYLRNIEDELVNRRTFHDGSTMFVADNLQNRRVFPGFSKNELEMVSLPSGTKLYLKRFYCGDDMSKNCIANEIVFSRLYNTLGVNALKYFPLIVGDKCEDYGKDVAVASQDLNTVNGLCIEPFSSYKALQKYITRCGYKINNLLKYQEELVANSCDTKRSKMLLANYIKTCILDIICMMADNHQGNKNVVRKDRIVTPEDIISFDLEDSEIDLFENCTYKDFIYEIYHTPDVFSGRIDVNENDKTYMDSIYSIKSLLNNGDLPLECVELLDNLLKLNFDELIRKTEGETGFIVPQNKKDFYKKLIDVNQETFCK